MHTVINVKSKSKRPIFLILLGILAFFSGLVINTYRADASVAVSMWSLVTDSMIFPYAKLGGYILSIGCLFLIFGILDSQSV